ncbi:MAG: hypothetical protein JW874_08840 [Spirochaetales bacterium]|nr:hypothetical protein [Spirochaetales bacterium]
MPDSTNSFSVPRIKRAREYHLYDTRGRRYLDFWQEGGRALLGHRPAQLSLALKNILGRGLLAAYPGIYEQRLEKALAILLPGYLHVHVFPDFYDALVYLSARTGRKIRKTDIAEPVFGISGDISWWRPFLDCTYPEVIIPCLPLPGLSFPVIVAEKAVKSQFVCHTVSPLVLGGLCRIIYTLLEIMTGNPWDGKRFTARNWKSAGPYLVYEGTETEYRALYDRGLRTGVLFTPAYPSFSLLPALYDEGELRAFYKGEADA